MEFITVVLPVTGPVIKTTGSPTGLYDTSKRGYRQARPIDRPLDYTGYGRRVGIMTRPGYYVSQSDQFTNVMSNSQSSYQYAINDTASKLRGKVSDQALWSVNFAEYSQSLGMMSQRLVQLSRFARAVLTRNPSAIARSLGINGRRKSPAKSVADTWLEYSFGWKPLVEDIYSTVDLLQNPIKATRVKASRTYSVARSDSRSGNIITAYDVSGTDFCTMGCEVKVNNPNLYLANNLGLANPATLIWELIPFSFVVDWFASVGQFLNSGTDWLGLTVTNPYTTYGTVRAWTKFNRNIYDSPQTWSSTGTGWYVRRRLAIVESQIIVRPFRLWGWQRAANAAAVLTQLVR